MCDSDAGAKSDLMQSAEVKAVAELRIHKVYVASVAPNDKNPASFQNEAGFYFKPWRLITPSMQNQ
jgi:hypothetical protein